jgi:hypothetical protein
MKHIRKLRGIFLVILLTFSLSCSEDFLREDPLSFLSPENTFKDAAGLQTALNASLKGVFNQWNGDTRELMFNHNMSDATVVSATDKQDAFVDLRRYATPQNTRNNDAGRTRSFYTDNYGYIKAANTVIDYIDIPEWDGGENDPERNHLLGSAYFLRAFFYMQLTTQFGNVAFPLNVVSESRQDFKVFHMQGIWDQMITDLEWAIQYVKPKSEIPRGQAPNAAVRMLLAKYYMLNGKFAEAEAQMDIVLTNGESRLFTDADVNVATVRVGNNYNPYNGELLVGLDCEQPADAVNLLHKNEGGQKLTNPEGIWYLTNAAGVDGSQGRAARIRSWGPNFVSTTNGVKAPPTGTVTGMNIAQNSISKQMHKWGRGQGFARPSDYAQFDIWLKNGEIDRQDYRHKRGNWFDMDMLQYDNPDLEKNGSPYFLQPAQLWFGSTLLCLDSIRCWFGYPMFKFYAQNIEDNVQRQDGGKMDMYVYRIAEAYLIRAEARYWQNDLAGCVDDINVIRARANAIYVYTIADVTADGIGAVLDERVRELYGEEYRHDELVRIAVILAKFGKSYNGKTYSVSGTDLEKSLSTNNFYYDRVMEKNNFFRDNIHWSTYPDIGYTMNPMHIFWPVYEPYLIGNVQAVLNQTTGYDGSEKNIEPLTHVVQPAGVPNIDPMEAIGER